MTLIICLVIAIGFSIVAVMAYLKDSKEKKERQLELQNRRKTANARGKKRG
jgi:hypothetical protein